MPKSRYLAFLFFQQCFHSVYDYTVYLLFLHMIRINNADPFSSSRLSVFRLCQRAFDAIQLGYVKLRSPATCANCLVQTNKKQEFSYGTQHGPFLKTSATILLLPVKVCIRKFWSFRSVCVSWYGRDAATEKPKENLDCQKNGQTR